MAEVEVQLEADREEPPPIRSSLDFLDFLLKETSKENLLTKCGMHLNLHYIMCTEDTTACITHLLCHCLAL